jgi:hypothetical protein
MSFPLATSRVLADQHAQQPDPVQHERDCACNEPDHAQRNEPHGKLSLARRGERSDNSAAERRPDPILGRS